MSDSIFCELSQYGLIRFSGEEAEAFLQNQLSCDVAALTRAGSTYGAYCNPKGRMLATFLLWRAKQGFYMQLPATLREPIEKQLSRYILRAKVKAADATAQCSIFGVAGVDAAARVRRAVNGVPRDVHEVNQLQDAVVIHLPGDRYEIVSTQGGSAGVLDALSDGARKADSQYWDWLDIRAGVPVIQPATQEQFVPQMANLDLIGGVTYDKGCYPGQEIVARMHFRGSLKQRMYLANLASNDRPRPGEKVYSAGFGEQACGTIVNAARSPEGGHDLLAVIQINAAERGDLRWNSLNGPALELLPLPYTVT